MEALLETALLYDFYGELLTQHQREIYEDFALNDLSLGEISVNRGISRQGVYDIIKRCRKQLISYEEKLHLVERFLQAKDILYSINECADQIIAEADNKASVNEYAGRIKTLTNTIIKDL